MKQRTSFRPLAHEGGQTLVEFALSIMVLLTLVFGLIEFGRAVYAASVVQWAAQQGARVGVEKYRDAPNDDALETLVDPAVRSRLVGLHADVAEIDVTTEPNDCEADPDAEIVHVHVTYPFAFVVIWFGDEINLQASACMVAH